MRYPAAGLPRYLSRKALDLGFNAMRMGTAVHRSGRTVPAGLEGRTLVILLEGLGDSLTFTPALRALRRSFPNAHIDLLVNDISYEVYRTSFDVDNFILWRGNLFRTKKLLSLVKVLKANRYRNAITPSLLFRHTSLTYLAGSSVRAGFNVDGRGMMLNVQMPLDRTRHRIQCYLDLVAELGATDHGHHMELEISPRDEFNAEAIAVRLLGFDSRPFVVIHPGTKQDANRWPPERYARLADQVAEDYGALVAFTGAEADRSVVQQIKSLMQTEAPSLVGQTTLRELAALLKRCELLICPDTGAMHLGSAVGVPTVVLMGGRNGPMEWRPLSPDAYVIRREVSCSPCHQSDCPQGEVRCMDSITLDDVLEGVDALMARSSTTGGS